MKMILFDKQMKQKWKSRIFFLNPGIKNIGQSRPEKSRDPGIWQNPVPKNPGIEILDPVRAWSLVANLALSGGPDLGGWRESRQWQDGSRPARSRFSANKIFTFLWNPGAGDSCRRLWQDASSSDGTLHRRQYRENGRQGLNECFYHTSGAVLYICDWWLNVHCTLYSHYN